MKYDWSKCVGQKYNSLTVLELAGKDNNNHPLLKCRCDCGNICIKGATQVKGGIRKNCGKKCGLKREDVTGQRFGKLTALEFSHHKDGNGIFWKFKCDCGKEKVFNLSRVKRGYINSCGCLRKENAKKAVFKDLTGQNFNHLTVIEYAGQRNRRTMWLCKCDCGNEVCVDSSSLKSGNTTACGCRQSEGWGNSLTHGMSKTRIYKTWQGMKSRCYNHKATEYSEYGGRGITVCQEWIDSFETFYQWAIANGYSDELTIDRINNDGNYEPSNCRWVTRTVQMNNMRNNNIIEYKGRKQTLAEWARELGFPYYILNGRINNRKWSIEKAFETPIQKRGGCH